MNDTEVCEWLGLLWTHIFLQIVKMTMSPSLIIEQGSIVHANGLSMLKIWLKCYVCGSIQDSRFQVMGT